MFQYLFSNITSAVVFLLGIVSIFSSIDGQINLAAWLVIIATFLYLLDIGTTPLPVRSKDSFEKEFESFADLVCFGVAPLVLLFVDCHLSKSFIWMALFFLYSLSVALRLARIDITRRRDLHFSGLPTNAAACFIAASVLFFNSTGLVLHPLAIKLSLLVLSVLMMSIVPYPSAINFSRFILIFMLIAFIIVFIVNRALSVWLTFLVYILFGPIFILSRRRQA